MDGYTTVKKQTKLEKIKSHLNEIVKENGGIN